MHKTYRGDLPAPSYLDPIRISMQKPIGVGGENLFLPGIIPEYGDCMSKKVRVGVRGQIVLPKTIRKKHHIKEGTLLEVTDTEEGFLLKPYNQLAEMKGLGKGIFGDPVRYQKEIRKQA